MTWIQEAQDQADRLKKEAEEAERQKIELAAEIQRARLAEYLPLFHDLTREVFESIEDVMARAEKNGLIVEGPAEGYRAYGGYNGSYLAHEKFLCEDADGKKYTYEAWAYSWELTEPVYGEKLTIALGVNRYGKRKKRLFRRDEIIDVYTLTNSEIRAETLIKDWLLSVYSLHTNE